MEKLIPAYFLYLSLLFSCQPQSPSRISNPQEQAKEEVLGAEKAFNDLAEREGLKTAFLAFAAENAVLSRDNRIIRGKEAMQAYFEAGTLEDIRLTWSPDFVDVSGSGDLAYTYGKYRFTAVDSSGQAIRSEGIFHTVWKKQRDGSWKFVYD